MNQSAKQNTLSLVTAAFFTALTAVCSQISIPMPTEVPLTLQTFAVALCGYVLGVKWGLASIAAYILLGLAGVPVFAGFKGGIQSLFAASGGFIYGFILFTLFCGLSFFVSGKPLKICLGFAGLALCHLTGIIHFAVVYKTGFIPAFLTVSMPYLIKDIVSVILAFFISLYIRKRIGKIIS